MPLERLPPRTVLGYLGRWCSALLQIVCGLLGFVMCCDVSCDRECSPVPVPQLPRERVQERGCVDTCNSEEDMELWRRWLIGSTGTEADVVTGADLTVRPGTPYPKVGD